MHAADQPPEPHRQLDPGTLSPAERYKLLIGCIAPRPIGVISTINRQGQHNLAPYSFFNGVGSNPMMLLFCPANTDDGREKDSLANAKPLDDGGTGCFVANLADHAHIRRVVVAAEPLPHGESEFDLAGLTPAPSARVAAPRLLESPASFECQTVQVIRTNPGAPAGGNIVIGRVVHIWIRHNLITDRMHIDQRAIDLVGRMGGFTYTRTTDQFDLRRGRPAPDAL